MSITKSKNGFADYPHIPRKRLHETVRFPESHHWLQHVLRTDQRRKSRTPVSCVHYNSIISLASEAVAASSVYFLNTFQVAKLFFQN